jgi:hypothetical protein
MHHRRAAADRARTDWVKPVVKRIHAGSAEIAPKPGTGTDGGGFS